MVFKNGGFMISTLHSDFKLLASKEPSNDLDIKKLKKYFKSVPEDYIETVFEATEIEIGHSEWKVIRIWGPLGCIDMDEAYNISGYIDDSFPIGDDEGGQVIIYMTGNNGYGLYLCDYSTLDIDEAVWIAPSLNSLLCQAVGREVF